MTLEEMKQVVLDLKKFLSLPALYLGGEAFLRPETMELIRFATAQGVFIKIVTNGTMLNEKVSRELVSWACTRCASRSTASRPAPTTRRAAWRAPSCAR